MTRSDTFISSVPPSAFVMIAGAKPGSMEFLFQALDLRRTDLPLLHTYEQKFDLAVMSCGYYRDRRTWQLDEKGRYGEAGLNRKQTRDILIQLGVPAELTAVLNNVNASKAKKWEIVSTIDDDEETRVETTKTKEVGAALEFQSNKEGVGKIYAQAILSTDHNGSTVTFKVYVLASEFLKLYEANVAKLEAAGLKHVKGSVVLKSCE